MSLWLKRKGFKISEPSALQTSTDQQNECDHLVLHDAASSEDEEHAQPDPNSSNPAGSKDWVERRKTYRKSFHAWSAIKSDGMSPGGYLVVMRSAITPAVNLTYALLNLVGDKWEEGEQRKLLESGQRSYPVLEAARGIPLQDFWAGMQEAFHGSNSAI